MINLNGKSYRNLEEQVLKNQDDIETMKQLGMPGVKVTAIVDSIEDITEPIVGAFYLVKNEENTYDLYVYTADEEFFNLGEFPKSGPQGVQGIQGNKGDTGENSIWYSGSAFPAETVNTGDMFLNTTNYQVYRYNGSQWVSQTNIKGAAGRDGLNGNSITSIDSQHQGSETIVTINTDKLSPVVFSIPDGEPGVGFHIAHIYPDDVPGASMPSSLPSYTPPDPDPMALIINGIWPAANANPADAVLVKTSQDGDYIYVILVDSETQEKYYDNVGQIQSITGPAGSPGTQIMDSEDIIKEAAGAQYPNTYKLYINSIPYLTTAPTADNANGLKIVVLDAEPATYYDGYYYIITEE